MQKNYWGVRRTRTFHCIAITRRSAIELHAHIAPTITLLGATHASIRSGDVDASRGKWANHELC